jgi:hypothetical protein
MLYPLSYGRICAIAVVFLIVPLVIVPTMTSTIVSHWTDRALDAERMNLRENHPEQEAAAHISDYYGQRGVERGSGRSMSATVLGAFAKEEAAAQGVQTGLYFLSAAAGAMGLAAATPGPRRLGATALRVIQGQSEPISYDLAPSPFSRWIP